MVMNETPPMPPWPKPSKNPARLGMPVTGEPPADHQRHGAIDAEGGERHHHRGDIDDLRDDAVDEAAGEARREPAGDRERHAVAVASGAAR